MAIFGWAVASLGWGRVAFIAALLRGHLTLTSSGAVARRCDLGRLRVCEVKFDELFHGQLLLLRLSKVVLSELLLLALHHSFELFLEVLCHSGDALEDKSALLGVLGDRNFSSQKFQLFRIQVLFLNCRFFDHLFDPGLERQFSLLLLLLACFFLCDFPFTSLVPLLVSHVHYLALRARQQ